MRSLLLLTLFLTVPFLTGCPKSKPQRPSVLARVASYEIDRFDHESGLYYTAVDAGQFEQARRLRDRIIDRLKANIDANYQEFENQLFTGRATQNVLFDIVDFGAGVAITITNGERAKNIISAALTGFKGGRKSIDENFFRERTTQVIISQMQTSRARIEAVIIRNKIENGVEDYTLDAALGDLINYFYAGTLQKGLQELAKETGQNAMQAEGEVRKLQGIPITPEATQTFADLSTSASNILTALRRDLQGNDVARRDAAVVKLQRIVAALEKDTEAAQALQKVSASSQDTDGLKLRTALIEMRRTAALANNNSLLNKINQAIVDNAK